MSSELKRFRELTYPPPFPDGWYRVAASGDIKPGSVQHVQCAGLQVALFRSRSSGRIAAVDTFCPHQGANLAHGHVQGDRLQCPFHGWQVDGDGRFRDCPEGDDRPLIHPHWEVVDYYGMVMLYRSARADARAPYRLPPQPKIDDGRFVRRGDYDAGETDMHIVEFAENIADFRHFAQLHGAVRIPWTNIRLPWIRVRHEPSWRPDDELEHVSHFGDEATVTIGRRAVEWFRARSWITFFGPGSIVKFDFEIPGVGEITLFQTHTPVEALRQRVTFRWFAARRTPRLLASLVVGSWVSQWRQDAEIWKDKIYRQRPLWAAADGPLAPMRAWYRQFYPEDLTEGPPGSSRRGG